LHGHVVELPTRFFSQHVDNPGFEQDVLGATWCDTISTINCNILFHFPGLLMQQVATNVSNMYNITARPCIAWATQLGHNNAR